MTEIAKRLADLAERVDDMKWRAVWPALHWAAYPVDDGYAERVGIVFAAVSEAADHPSWSYLDAVLKSRHKERDLGSIIKAAAAHTDRGSNGTS